MMVVPLSCSCVGLLAIILMLVPYYVALKEKRNHFPLLRFCTCQALTSSPHTTHPSLQQQLSKATDHQPVHRSFAARQAWGMEEERLQKQRTG